MFLQFHDDMIARLLGDRKTCEASLVFNIRLAWSWLVHDLRFPLIDNETEGDAHKREFVSAGYNFRENKVAEVTIISEEDMWGVGRGSLKSL